MINIAKRIGSIDVFRGITIFLMIFVNDVASVTGIPAWLKHVPQDKFGMTFVDVVFPAFLFIVGMSIPFALEKRLNKTQSRIHVLWHIITRSVSLLIIGILMVNIGRFDAVSSAIGKNLWAFLMFFSVILLWNRGVNSREGLRHPSLKIEKGRFKKIFHSAELSFLSRGIGLIILVLLIIIYRGNPSGGSVWFVTSWWGILGLIGWAYLFVGVIYLLSSDKTRAMYLSLIVFILLYYADKSGQLKFLYQFTEIIWIGGHIGTHAGIVTAGVLFSTSLQKTITGETTAKVFIKTGLVLSVVLFITGYLTQGDFDINKTLATPSWALYSISICMLIFLVLYYLIDIKGGGRYFSFFKPAGSNPLLAYLLPDVYYFGSYLLGFNFFKAISGNWISGIAVSIIFSVLMVYLTKFLGSKGIKMNL
ncbi:MAG: DUF5009 domain-containing protein [Ignavibacteriales bacterium]|nr:DUF5009 domain-containing protein [Ignavibacteriales bacterium]MCF8306566.1 DUF5009 domain-containing protein [Ignavibacteriales bacterium]MCF8316365.1 DUF5009 domain-containing protein [Ignavibacteriales bacterium]MCF8437677.1 DUF5009 domain-containing protein [Ignavibacteriales bacterium]